jgi:hypothetical protein
MKLYADRNHIEREFQEGDWVYLWSQPYRQKSMAMRKNLKLSPKKFGPFQILQRIGMVAYRLDLPSSTRVHPVFHVSYLKKKLGHHIVPLSTLPPVDHNGEFQPEIELVLNHWVAKKRGCGLTEVLIRWK